MVRLPPFMMVLPVCVHGAFFWDFGAYRPEYLPQFAALVTRVGRASSWRHPHLPYMCEPIFTHATVFGALAAAVGRYFSQAMAPNSVCVGDTAGGNDIAFDPEFHLQVLRGSRAVSSKGILMAGMVRRAREQMVAYGT